MALKKYNVLDTFAGAGGFSLGFHLTGKYRIIGAIESDQWAADTFAYNHPKTKVIVDDIRNVTDKQLLENFERKVDILLGGPPCQGFSIANKKAGCFTQKNKSKKYKKILSKANNLAEKRQTCTKQINSKVFCTEYANHAKELADSIVAQIIANPQEEETNLLVVAGGDGTSYEVQTALFQAAQQSEKKHKTVTQDICLLRLPLGTGNDGTDGRTLEETINLLLGEIKFEKNPALKILYQGNPTQKDVENTGRKVLNLQSSINTAPWFSFNVFSMGIDAYVCYMTNVLKSKMPGNFYHFFIPICAILYDKVFSAGIAKVEYYDENNTLIEEISTPIELFVVGISGYRTYGGGHKILATKENTIIVPKLSTLKLLLNFKKIKDGNENADIKIIGVSQGYFVANELTILSLEAILQTPLCFNCSDFDLAQTSIIELYSRYINQEQNIDFDPELHFLVLTTLENKEHLDKIASLIHLIHETGNNLPIFVDVLIAPVKINTNIQLGTIKSNLSEIIELKNDYLDIVNNIFYSEMIDENGMCHQYDNTSIAILCGNMLRSLIYANEELTIDDPEFPISTYSMSVLEIDKYKIINNLHLSYLQQIAEPIIQANIDDDCVDIEKVQKIFREIYTAAKEQLTDYFSKGVVSECDLLEDFRNFWVSPLISHGLRRASFPPGGSSCKR